MDLRDALISEQAAFGVELQGEAIAKLVAYSDLIAEHNPLLHLVAPMSNEEFAVRHILESLVLASKLAPNTHFADVGAGAGLPSIPCLIVRDDLRATLIESKQKKADFLTLAANKLELGDRAAVVANQFAETRRGRDVTAVTCRALDRFTSHLPRLLKWSYGAKKYFFGGPALADALDRAGAHPTKQLLPLSEQRFLFEIEPESRQA